MGDPIIDFINAVKEFRMYLDSRFETIIRITYTDRTVDLFLYIDKKDKDDVVLCLYDGCIFEFEVEIQIDKKKSHRGHPLYYVIEEGLFPNTYFSDAMSESSDFIHFDFIRDIKRKNDELWQQFRALTKEQRESIRAFFKVG